MSFSSWSTTRVTTFDAIENPKGGQLRPSIAEAALLTNPDTAIPALFSYVENNRDVADGRKFPQAHMSYLGGNFYGFAHPGARAFGVALSGPVRCPAHGAEPLCR